MKKGIIIGVVVIIILVLTIGVYYTSKPKQMIKLNNFIATAEIENSSNYVDSAGYYESSVKFTSLDGKQIMNVFICTKSWDWIKVGSCYYVNQTAIINNRDGHLYSAMLSGCYVGELKEVACA
jgi:hypothetical protein